MTEPELLTVAEIAERLKVNQMTVRNWISRGELESVRVGARRVRIPRAALEKFLGAPIPGDPLHAGAADSSYIVPGCAPTPTSKPGAVFDNVKIARASETAADLADLAQLAGYSLKDGGGSRRRIAHMTKAGQINGKFSADVAAPAGGLGPTEIEKLAELADAMVSCSARLPEESQMARELAATGGRLKAMTLRAARR